MNLRQKVALVLVAATLVLSAVCLVEGELHDGALGAFIAVTAGFTNGLWQMTPLWSRRRH